MPIKLITRDGSITRVIPIILLNPNPFNNKELNSYKCEQTGGERDRTHRNSGVMKKLEGESKRKTKL